MGKGLLFQRHAVSSKQLYQLFFRLTLGVEGRILAQEKGGQQKRIDQNQNDNDDVFQQRTIQNGALLSEEMG